MNTISETILENTASGVGIVYNPGAILFLGCLEKVNVSFEIVILKVWKNELLLCIIKQIDAKVN